MAAKKNIYEKLADARHEFHQLELKKSGYNKFAGYSYFELEDFLIPGMECFRNHRLVPVIYFTDKQAVMELVNMDSGKFITFTSPMAEAHLKGCHPIQNMGAVEKYQRRYLWMMALEVVEHDQLDSSEPLTEEAPAASSSVSTTTSKAAPKKVPAKKKASAKKAAPKATPPVSEIPDDLLEIKDNLGAAQLTDFMISLATNMHSESVRSLAGFWKANAAVIDALDQDWPDEYNRLKETFTKLKEAAKTKQE